MQKDNKVHAESCGKWPPKAQAAIDYTLLSERLKISLGAARNLDPNYCVHQTMLSFRSVL